MILLKQEVLILWNSEASKGLPYKEVGLEEDQVGLVWAHQTQ